MKRRHFLRGAALFVCLLLVLTACSNPFSKEPVQPGQANQNERPFANRAFDGEGRRTIPYGDMEYQRPDGDGIKQQLITYTEQLATVADFKALQTIDNAVGEMLEEFYTANVLAMLRTYQDVTDTYFEDEYRYCEDLSVELQLLLVDFNRAIVEGPFAEDYRAYVGDYQYDDLVLSLRMSSPEVETQLKRQAQISIDYNKMMATATVEVDGVTYTFDDIDAVYYEQGYSAYAALAQAFMRQNAPVFADLYIELILLDREVAQILGFNSAAEMRYLKFSRDYTPEDALAYCQQAKTLFAPMVMPAYMQDFGSHSADMDATLAVLPGLVGNVSPQLTRAFNFMLEYDLYDFEVRDNKQTGVAFQVDISGYDAPFIYGNWDGTMGSTTTMLHEFGHFYDSWANFNKPSLFNLDIAETYSQGLELLMWPYFGELTSNPVNARKDHLRDFINPLTFQPMLEEFQLRAYEMEDLSNENLAALYTDLLRQYGLLPLYGLQDEDGNDYSWFQISHLFDSPFYTISYYTSALAALQIWSVSQEDWYAGADIYLQMLHADQNQPFTQLLQSVGLSDVGDDEVLQEIRDQMNAVLVG